MTIEDIYNVFDISEFHELRNAIETSVIYADDATRFDVLDKLDNVVDDKSADFIRDFFQEYGANRKDMMQDYTPQCVCDLLARLVPNDYDQLTDICSGTGSLSLACGNNNRDGFVICEELSTAVIPILVLNYVFRNRNAIVKEKNVVTNTVAKVYIIEKAEKYSSVTVVDSDTYNNIKQNYEKEQSDLIISNPPYSLRWTRDASDKRFDGYDLPPKQYADYLFVIDAVKRLSATGRAFFILPNGVLFRGNTEAKIRTQLIENNLIDAVICLPSDLFQNTSIPTNILVLNKHKQDSAVLFVDASELCTKVKKYNVITDKDRDKIADIYKSRSEVKDISKIVNYETIKDNDYNLNPPRYEIKEIKEERYDLKEIASELVRLKDAQKENTKALTGVMSELTADGTTATVLDEVRALWQQLTQ